MKTRLVLLIGMLLMVWQKAEAQTTWKLQKSQVAFTIKMLGANVKGTFSELDTKLNFDEKHWQSGHISATIPVASIDTDNDLRNKHLKEKETFFFVQQFPTIKIQSLKIEQSTERFVGTFNLTIKNTTKTLRIPFTFEQHGNQAVFQADFVLNRRDWQVGGGTWGMSDEVHVSVSLFAAMP